MNELLKKYESIDQSKLNEGAIKILNRVKTLTSDFSTDDAKNNKIAEDVLNEIIKKYPDSVKIVKRTPKAKPAPKKVAKAKKPATTSTAKKSGNNIMSVAKEIQKAGESWKDAMERAKQVLKERREGVVSQKKSELEKLYALVKTKKELKGFTNSDLRRDSRRTALPRGRRISKDGNLYYENRENRTDRLAPNYPKNLPLLAKGGGVGSKKYNTQYNVGKAKYVVNYYDGVKKHKDGSDFYDIKIFKNKKDFEDFLTKLSKEGYREMSYDTAYEKGGSVSNERMYNFLKDDLEKLEKAINEGDTEQVEMFFSYWIGSSNHLKSLKTETNDRMYNFLKEDLETLEKAINDGDKEEVERFFSYWGRHLESLKMANGGSLPFMTDTNFGNFQNTGAFAKGGSVSNERMYNFLKDDLEKLEIAINDGDKEKTEMFFIYWLGSSGHLKSLETKTNERMYNFLKEDLEKLEVAVENNDTEEVERFFSYWGQHLESLKMANGGSLPFMTDPNFGNFQNTGAFELGGAFMTDLAGHTGGSLGTGNPTPLSGFSGTYYTGLVGETGAMSSGELFAKGGAIKNQYKDRTDKDIWNSFSTAQRQHFLKDHFEEIQTVAINSGVNNINHFGNLIGWANRDYEDLPTYIKSPFNYHTESGQYAYGGKTKSLPSMRQLNIEQIASLTGTRNVGGVEKFVDDNNLTDSEVSNLMMGIGRGLISKGYFITALVGNKNNPIQKEVIAFAKSDKAYKMADGGDVLPPSKTYGENIYKAMQKFNISDSEARKKYGQYTISQWNELLSDKMADGGFMNNVYGKGGEIADIQKMKKALVAKAKSKGIYENFGQNEVRDLQDKYGYTNSVREFDNWAMNFDLSQMSDGGFMNNVYADGGFLNENQIEKLDEGFTIPQLNDMLDKMFPYSFGFEVYKQEQSSSRNEGKFSYDYDNKVKDDKLKLYFYFEGYGRDLNYQVSQGQENTYFKFLLVDDKINTYVGGFGFKDKGDVDESYITKFISFLEDAYHYSFKVRHSVMANGGFVGTVEFNAGDIVWQKDEKRYATVMNNYGDAINGDSGELRLDTTGNTIIFTYDKKTYDNTGYNLVKLGDKGDTGKFLPEVVAEMKESAKRLIDSRKERKDTEMIEYYEGIYKRLLDGEFDSMTGVVKGMLNKKIQNLAEKKGLTMDDLGRDEYNKVMTQALVESLTDANYHEEAKEVVVKAEGKTKWSDELYEAESFNPDEEVKSFAREVARECEWGGDDILNAYFFITKMQGSKVANMIDNLFLNKKSKSTSSSSSKPTKYIDNDDIESVTLNVNGNFITFAGKDFLNGANLMEKGGDLSKIATYFPIRDIVKVTLKNGETIKPLNGYWLKKGSKPISTPSKTPKKSINSGARYKFDIGDKVMLDDSGYVKSFVGFDISKPAEILERSTSKTGGKTYYFYKIKTADGRTPFNQAEQSKLTLVEKNNFADGGFIYDVYAKGGELQGKFLAEIKVPYNFEDVVEDEYEFSRFLSKALTNKFNFGNGAWGVKIVKPLFGRDYSKIIVVEIEIPLGVTQGGGLDKFDVAEFMSKTLTKKWFGNGVWGVDIISNFANGGSFLEDNEGFMRADNEFNYRYPTKDVYIETLDEEIDLTSYDSDSNEVDVRMIIENIDLNDDNRIRARMTQPSRGTTEKLGNINPRAFEFIDLPKLTSNEHKND